MWFLIRVIKLSSLSGNILINIDTGGYGSVNMGAAADSRNILSCELPFTGFLSPNIVTSNPLR